MVPSRARSRHDRVAVADDWRVVERRGPRRYTLADILAVSDYSTAPLLTKYQWVDAIGVGRELF